MATQKRATQSRKANKRPRQSTPVTFMDHVQELRGRLFWVACWFVLASGAIFPFFSDVIKLLMRPLGTERLYYLTPVGGLSFAIKVCMYVGVIATLPILIYHLYCFIAPAVRRHNSRQALRYVTLSLLLAVSGVVFAYTVSLPAAIHFLTHFGIAGVSPMLTVDSYLSFIVSYLLAGALLFQLPLLMLIIDSVTPTPPSKWGKYERHMIVAAFVIAMFITPTPNITDQVLLALPIVIMYQIGIGLVYLRYRKPSRQKAVKAISAPEFQPEVSQPVHIPTRAVVSLETIPRASPRRSMDFLRTPPPRPAKPLASRTVLRSDRPSIRSVQRKPGRSIDGMVVI